MIPMTSIYSKEYTLKLLVGQMGGNDFNELGALPATGSISINVVAAAEPYVGVVTVAGNKRVFNIMERIESHFNARYTGFGGINANSRELRNIVYEKIRKSDGTILSSLEVTSFNLREQPWVLDVYKVGDMESFSFDLERMYNESGTYIRITYNYE